MQSNFTTISLLLICACLACSDGQPSPEKPKSQTHAVLSEPEKNSEATPKDEAIQSETRKDIVFGLVDDLSEAGVNEEVAADAIKRLEEILDLAPDADATLAERIEAIKKKIVEEFDLPSSDQQETKEDTNQGEREEPDDNESPADEEAPQLDDIAENVQDKLDEARKRFEEVIEQAKAEFEDARKKFQEEIENARKELEEQQGAVRDEIEACRAALKEDIEAIRQELEAASGKADPKAIEELQKELQDAMMDCRVTQPAEINQ